MTWSSIRRRMPVKRSFRMNRSVLLFFIICISFLSFWYLYSPNSSGLNSPLIETKTEILQRRDYNTSSLKPIIFIGGMPRSGTTLMRAILDSHPLVRCGEETRVIPRILGMRAAWEKSSLEWSRSVSSLLNLSHVRVHV